MAESTVVACPNCGKKYKISADKLGRTFKCTGCETRFAAGAEPTPPPMEEPVMESSSTDSDSYEQESAATTDPATTVDYSTATTGKPKTSGMAIAALIFGLLSCVPGANVLAVILGFLGMKKANSGLAGGKGLAITGLILGVLGILADAGVGAVVVPAIIKGRHALLETVVNLNMHSVYSAITEYQAKNDQHYPPNLTEAWKADPTLKGTDFVSTLTKDTPAADPSQLEAGGHLSYTYIYPGPDATSVSADDVLFYEKWTDINGSEVNVFFGDGHSKMCKPAEAQRLISMNGKHPTMMMPPMTPTMAPPSLTAPASAP